MVYEFDIYYLHKYRTAKPKKDKLSYKTHKKSSLKKIAATTIAALGLLFFGATYSPIYKHTTVKTQETVKQDIRSMEEQTQSKPKTLEELCSYHNIDKEVEKNIKNLTEIPKNKVTIEKIFTEATKYDDYFDKAAEETGVNKNLIKAYISVESGHTYFSKNAMSPKGAAGPAQIMEETAKYLNLKIIKDKKGKIIYDERRDPKKSILASARFFKEWVDIHEGDRILGLAVYNGGPKLVENQIRRKKTNKFTKLFRIGETKEYVIKVLSRKKILEEPQKYNLNIEKKPLFSETIGSIQEHELKKGETIYSLIQKYKTTPEWIKKYNPSIVDINEVPTGIKIRVPKTYKP